MEADTETVAAIRDLVERTHLMLSRPGGDFAALFGEEDIAVAGSGQGELLYGPGQVIRSAEAIAARGRPWVADEIRVWRRGDVAWAQILGHVDVSPGCLSARVAYRTTGVFTLAPAGWRWVYWGGAEPQEHPGA